MMSSAAQDALLHAPLMERMPSRFLCARPAHPSAVTAVQPARERWPTDLSDDEVAGVGEVRRLCLQVRQATHNRVDDRGDGGHAEVEEV